MSLLSKKKLLAALLLFVSFSFAQPKIDIKYYVNNTQSSIEEVKVFLVTKTDTITPKIENGKIKIPDGFKDNFSLFAQFHGRTLKIGSYRPNIFNEIDAIVVGQITDFAIIKKYWQWENAYIIDNEYVVIIPDATNIIDVIYCTVKKDENVSLHSNYKTWAPTFTFQHEVITRKN